MSGFKLPEDYNTVAERYQEFLEKHPEGSTQIIDWGVTEIGGRTYVWAKSAAYRSPDDPRPGIEVAWEPFPGPTPYTKESELMNAATSANGRAIVAALAASTKKGMASAEEVRNREATQQQPQQPITLGQADARIKLARGDVDTLLALYTEANGSGAGDDVLNLIKYAGEQARLAHPVEGVVQ